MSSAQRQWAGHELLGRKAAGQRAGACMACMMPSAATRSVPTCRLSGSASGSEVMSSSTPRLLHGQNRVDGQDLSCQWQGRSGMVLTKQCARNLSSCEHTPCTPAQHTGQQRTAAQHTAAQEEQQQFSPAPGAEPRMPPPIGQLAVLLRQRGRRMRRVHCLQAPLGQVVFVVAQGSSRFVPGSSQLVESRPAMPTYPPSPSSPLPTPLLVRPRPPQPCQSCFGWPPPAPPPVPLRSASVRVVQHGWA